MTEDGGEIDQDLGHYERFLDINLGKEHNITTGQVYLAVIEKERRGEYLGKTVEAIPHVTDEIKRRIRKIANDTKADFVIIEIGGTIGEYQNELYFRGARMMKSEGEKVLFVHVGYLPVPKHLGEMKTKPMQQSVEILGRLGIQPDFIVCRSELPIDEVRKEKIALFCNVSKEDVISNPDLPYAYELPLVFEKQDLGNKILQKLNLKPRRCDLKDWEGFINGLKTSKKLVKIGVVGKYFDIGDFKLSDSYISVIEAIKHAAANNGVGVEISWIDSKDFEKDKTKLSILKELDGIVIPGGFGASGVVGKILAIQYARENSILFLGLCFGLQLAVVEFARNVCGLKNAHSTEIDPKTPHPVIDILPEQKKILEDSKYGATMRLGSYTAVLKEGSLVWKLYDKQQTASERHRHRYEVNPKYHEVLQKKGLIFSGTSPDRRLVEFVELPKHKYFVATQAHPEFKSRPLKPTPLFDGLADTSLHQIVYPRSK